MTNEFLNNRFSRRRLIQAAGGASTLAVIGFALGGKDALAQSGASITIGIGEDGYVSDARQRIGFMPFNTNIFETLVRLTPEFQIESMLAESWEFVEPNIWRFTLRSGITFHNGVALTSEAVVWTMERVASQGGGNIAMPAGATTAIDDLTFEIAYPEPNMRLVEQLCAPGIGSILAPNTDPAVERVGTGPFREVEYVPESHYTVEANAGYWGDDKPRVDQIRFVFYPDPATRLLALEAGEIDLNIEVDRQSADQLGGNLRLLASPAGGYETVSLHRNGAAPYDLLQDRAIRTAIAHAIDREAIYAGAWLGNATENLTLAPAAIFGDSVSVIGTIPYDPGRAGALLDEAGWARSGDSVRMKDGRTLSLTLVNGYPTATEHGSTAELLQAMLSEVGIGVSIVVSSDRAAYGEMLDRGEGDLWLEAAGQDDASPTYLFFTMAGEESYGKAFSAGPEFEELVKQATAAPTTEEAQALSAQAMNMALAEEVVTIPLAGFSRLWGASARIGEITPHPSRYSQRWTGLTVNE